MTFSLKTKLSKEFAVGLLFFAFSFYANAQAYEQIHDESKLEFRIKNMGISVNGSFSDFVVETNLMPEDLEHSYLNATVTVGSIDTGVRKRDKSLMDKKYFNSSEFPAIRFESKSLKQDDSGNLKLEGELRVKSVSSAVKIPIEVSQEGDYLFISSEFRVNRRDFGVGDKSWLMGDEVLVKVVYKGKK